MSGRIERRAADTSAVIVGERYAVTESIGHGGMADVYRAVDQVLGRTVAVKVLRDLTADESERERFMNEARTLARLNHPGLVTVLDAGTDGEQPFLVLELVEGRTLAASAGSALDPGRVAALGEQIADALTYVHSCGIVHRDVKPGNVLIGSDGRVKLADFGIARLVGSTTHHTRTGMTIGSPAYLSPEQVGGGDVTTAADVYSLGLVLLEALTGRKAFEGSSMEMAFARLKKPPEVPASLPAEWRQLLAEMTALEAADRPRSVDVAAWLRRIAGGADDPAATQLMEGAAPTRVLTGPARTSVLAGLRNRTVIALGSTLLALLVVIGLAAMVDDGTATPDNEVPRGVPAQLEEPLRELHEAVHGSPG